MFETENDGPCLVQKLEWGAMDTCCPPPTPPLRGYAPARFL